MTDRGSDGRRRGVRFGGGVLALVLALTGVLVPAAQASPSPRVPLPSENVCTGSWEQVGGVSLQGACSNHDDCYTSATDRRDCDVALHVDILKACDAGRASGQLWSPSLGPKKGDTRTSYLSCRAAADTYLFGARKKGREYYVNAGGTGDPT